MAHGSIDRESNPPAPTSAPFGISDFGRDASPRVLRDSVDLIIDPRLAATSTPVHRVTAVPCIVIPHVSFEEAVIEPLRLRVPPAPAPEPRPVARRASSVGRTIGWTIAAIASMSIGTVAGWATRPQSRVRPIATQLSANAHAPSLSVSGSVDSPDPIRAPLASPGVTPVATTINEESSPPASEEPSPQATEETVVAARAHASSHSTARSNNASVAAPEPAAAIAPIHVEAPAPTPVPSAAVERQSSVASNNGCASRCGDDLACAAACVVHGGRTEPAHATATQPSLPIPVPEAMPAPAPAVPDGPTHEQVARAIEGVLPAVRACGADDENSVARVTITFAASGRVTTANTESPYAGTPSGSCIARAVRGATVPPFSRATFTVRAPFEMR